MSNLYYFGSYKWVRLTRADKKVKWELIETLLTSPGSHSDLPKSEYNNPGLGHFTVMQNRPIYGTALWYKIGRKNEKKCFKIYFKDSYYDMS